MGAENAFSQAGGSGRDAFLRAPIEWDPDGAHRIWKLRALADGLRDAPAAFRRILIRYLLSSENSPARAGLEFQAPSSGPRLYFISRKGGGAIILLGAASAGLVPVRRYRLLY